MEEAGDKGKTEMLERRKERRKVWKLKEDNTREIFEGRVRELVSTDAPDLWKCFREGVLKACDEV